MGMPFHLAAVRALERGDDVPFEGPTSSQAEWRLDEAHLGPAPGANIALGRGRPRRAAQVADLWIEPPQSGIQPAFNRVCESTHRSLAEEKQSRHYTTLPHACDNRTR